MTLCIFTGSLKRLGKRRRLQLAPLQERQIIIIILIYYVKYNKLEDIMINFANTIFYVKDVPATVAFFTSAFGFKVKFIHEKNQYAELETGSTTLSFASETLAESNLPQGFTKNDLKVPPFACEITFTTENVRDVFDKAINAGALPLTQPIKKPWGQIVAYVRSPQGILIDIATPLP